MGLQFSGPQLSGGQIFYGAIILECNYAERNYIGVNHPRDNCPRDNYLGINFPWDNCPRTVLPYTILVEFLASDTLVLGHILTVFGRGITNDIEIKDTVCQYEMHLMLKKLE